MLPSLKGKYPVWSFFLAILFIVYAFQLVIAGSIRSEAAAHMQDALTPTTYLFLAPWIHSSHSHILQNVIVFVAFGKWTERRVSRRSFSLFVLASGYLSLYLPVAFDYGGLSVGFSGVTKALTTVFVLFHFTKFVITAGNNQTSLKQVAYHFLFFFVPFLFLLVTVARYTGYVPPPEGTSVSSHLTGIGLGILFFAQASRSEFEL